AGNITKQPYMQGKSYRISGELANTDKAMNHTFWLGIFPALTEIELNFVCSKIESYFGIGF
ncbi:MAG: lipopolysaccharide biosynthesis protein RfbH, partial [Betaproteobacteria bacterium]|nr:lipopolysaccharide biosynthesis protein RfbH [Betaproteobacteria bacterium]